MIYLTSADIANARVIYTTKSLKDVSIERPNIETDGLYGKLYYSTEFFPQSWSTEKSGGFNSQELADYLLEHTVDSDPRVAKVISDHFWDF